MNVSRNYLALQSNKFLFYFLFLLVWSLRSAKNSGLRSCRLNENGYDNGYVPYLRTLTRRRLSHPSTVLLAFTYIHTYRLQLRSNSRVRVVLYSFYWPFPYIFGQLFSRLTTYSNRLEFIWPVWKPFERSSIMRHFVLISRWIVPRSVLPFEFIVLL